MTPEEEANSIARASALLLLREARARRASVHLTPTEVFALLHALESMAEAVNKLSRGDL